MLGKVKDLLGIEGVKLDLVLPEKVDIKDGLLEGTVQLSSMRPQTVSAIKISLIEQYSRGRGEGKRVDDYLLGEMHIEQPIPIPVGQTVEIDFQLPFKVPQSEMDELSNRNLLFKGLVGLAKKARAVHSEYRVEAYAKVKGTALDPFIKSLLNVKS